MVRNICGIAKVIQRCNCIACIKLRGFKGIKKWIQG